MSEGKRRSGPTTDPAFKDIATLREAFQRSCNAALVSDGSPMKTHAVVFITAVSWFSVQLSHAFLEGKMDARFCELLSEIEALTAEISGGAVRH